MPPNDDKSRGKWLRDWLPMLVGIVLGVLGGGLIFFGAPARAVEPTADVGLQTVPADSPGLAVGNLAPDFELLSSSGAAVRLADYRGQVVLLNFWATWCIPCRAEMPLIQEASETLAAQGFIPLGINFDEPAEVVVPFATELGINFPLLLDPGGRVQRLYRVVGYPTSVVIDREGRIAAYHVGILAKSQLDQYLAETGLQP